MTFTLVTKSLFIDVRDNFWLLMSWAIHSVLQWAVYTRIYCQGEIPFAVIRDRSHLWL